jgi:hypothetical protein
VDLFFHISPTPQRLGANYAAIVSQTYRKINKCIDRHVRKEKLKIEENMPRISKMN